MCGNFIITLRCFYRGIYLSKYFDTENGEDILQRYGIRGHKVLLQSYLQDFDGNFIMLKPMSFSQSREFQAAVRAWCQT